MAEIHFVPGRLPSAANRFRYFPHIDTSYEPLYNDPPSTVQESFPRGYLERIKVVSALLEKAIEGKKVAMFSHAASVAIVAALLDLPLEAVGKFAPCGVYHLIKQGDQPWELVGSGADNSGACGGRGFNQSATAPGAVAHPASQAFALLPSSPSSRK